MEALHRSVLSNNWITLIFVFSILLLFLLKLFTTTKLKGYTAALFNKGFVEIEAEESYFSFSFFHLGFSLFTFLMLSITIFLTVKQDSVFLFGLFNFVFSIDKAFKFKN